MPEGGSGGLYARYPASLLSAIGMNEQHEHLPSI
jgi:hypothetical protein